MDRTIAPESPFLASVATAFRRRSKALSYIAGKREIERVAEHREDETLERLDVRLARNNSRSSPRVSVSVWSDRWVWIDARWGDRNGWQFEWTMSGRWLHPEDAPKMTKAVEESLSASYRAGQQAAERLAEIWQPLIAVGPSPV